MQVAALTEFAAPDRLQSALVIQAREVAAETGLTGYREITDALDRLATGETWPVTGESPLGLRFRLLAAENTAAGWATPWDNPSRELTQADRDAWKYRFRAAEAIMELIAGPPKRAARFVLGERKDPRLATPVRGRPGSRRHPGRRRGHHRGTRGAGAQPGTRVRWRWVPRSDLAVPQHLLDGLTQRRRSCRAREGDDSAGTRLQP